MSPFQGLAGISYICSGAGSGRRRKGSERSGAELTADAAAAAAVMTSRGEDAPSAFRGEGAGRGGGSGGDDAAAAADPQQDDVGSSGAICDPRDLDTIRLESDQMCRWSVGTQEADIKRRFISASSFPL